MPKREPTYKVEDDAPPWEPPPDPNTRWYRKALARIRSEPTVDAYPDREVPWHVVGPPGPTVPADRTLRRLPKPRSHPVSLFVKRHGKMREVKLLGLPLEIALHRLNRRIVAGWVMQEIDNTLQQMEEDDMALEHRRVDDNQRGGQGLAEYALILALIVIVAIAVLILLGTQIQAVFQQVADCIPDPTACL